MLSHLNESFARLENARLQLHAKLRACPAPQLQLRRAPQSWSINEILHHLVLAEGFAVSYLAKKLERFSSLKKTSWSAGLRSFILKWALRSPLKFKAPSPLVLPAPGLALEDLHEQWESGRRTLQNLLGRITPEMAQLALYRHPVAGLLTVVQMLTFMQEHFDHHLHQIEKILKSASSHSERAFENLLFPP
jgi:hypothetical protein